MLRSQTPKPRKGFTLVEILVVIAIIAILIALTAPALMKMFGRGSAADNVSTLRQLETALENFKQKYGVYPPSRIKLCPIRAMYGTTPLDQESLAILNAIWPRLSTPQRVGPTGVPIPGVPSFMAPANRPQDGIDWSGGQPGYKTPGGFIILEGDQCLVFFLGGIPSLTTPGCLGFSTDPTNPAALAGDRIGPFFDFKAARLYIRRTNPGIKAFSFYSYRDSYSDPKEPVPYAYFSAGQRTNGYNRLATRLPVTPAPTAAQLAAQNDCATVHLIPLSSGGAKSAGGPVWPYAEFMATAGSPLPHAPPRYHNKDTFQIISAGADGKFGTGTMVVGLDIQGVPLGPQNSLTPPITATVWSSANGFVVPVLGPGANRFPAINLAPQLPPPPGFATWPAYWIDYWPRNVWADDQTNFHGDVLSARGT